MEKAPNIVVLFLIYLLSIGHSYFDWVFIYT